MSETKLRCILSRMLDVMTYSPDTRTFTVSEIAWLNQPYMYKNPAKWLEAELAALSEWLPIESAPKDVAVLVVAGGSVDIATFWSSGHGAWVNGDGHMEHQPTHWMPLPSSPPNPARVERSEEGKAIGSATEPPFPVAPPPQHAATNKGTS